MQIQSISTGKERDAESGNDYFDARYYSSAMGRFMSPDWSAQEEPVPYAKLDNPQSLNLYSYVLNNPLVLEDNDGHEIIYASNLKNPQLVRDTIQAELANPNTSSSLSGYVGPNNPNLTIQSGDLSDLDNKTLTPDGQPGQSTTQGVTSPDIETITGSSTNSDGVTTQDVPQTILRSTTITIDNRTSTGDTPGVVIHETHHAGEARANPAQYNKDAKAEHSNPCHNCRPQEQRAIAAQKANEKAIKQAIKQIEKDRKKAQQ
jgi:RHS repeat-associated protein